VDNDRVGVPRHKGWTRIVPLANNPRDEIVSIVPTEMTTTKHCCSCGCCWIDSTTLPCRLVPLGSQGRHWQYYYEDDPSDGWVSNANHFVNNLWFPTIASLPSIQVAFLLVRTDHTRHWDVWPRDHDDDDWQQQVFVVVVVFGIDHQQVAERKSVNVIGTMMMMMKTILVMMTGEKNKVAANG
jgi:hypothetical protein